MREQVTNGCSGGCCEGFTLPLSLEEFKRMNQSIKEGSISYTRDNGSETEVTKDPDLEKIIDMIIPLGKISVDPQKQYYTFTEDYKMSLSIPEEEVLTPELCSFMEKKKHATEYHKMYWFWHRLIDGEITVNLFTCKHFDTVNRVCGNYENRPYLCQFFGKSCAYEGCTYACKRKEEEDKEIEDLRIRSLSPILDVETYKAIEDDVSNKCNAV